MALSAREIPMKAITLRCGAFALACLCLAACKDKHDPLKPTVAPAAVVAPAPAA
jgi:NADH:ubiquinone oxidoreductase subunit 4 (subunit M)